jgi:hypothetical protein
LEQQSKPFFVWRTKTVFNKDPIFWWAAGIFVLALVLMVATRDQFWLVLMIGSYLLRPTLASLGLARRYVDERQMSIQYRSGNIAFVAMIITCLVLAVNLKADGNPEWEMFIVVIVVGLAIRALFHVMGVMNARRAATKIIIAAGLLLTLFVSLGSLDSGVSWKTLLRVASMLAIVEVGLLSKRFPKIAGGMTFAITAALVFVILKKGLTIGQAGTALVVGVPLATAAAFLFTRDKSEPENGPKSVTGEADGR